MNESDSVQILYLTIDVQTALPLQQHLQGLSYQLTTKVCTSASDLPLAIQDYTLILVDSELVVSSFGDNIRTLWSKPTLPPWLILLAPGHEQDILPVLKHGLVDYLLKDETAHYVNLLPYVIERTRCQKQAYLKQRATSAALKQREREVTLLTRAGEELNSTLDFRQVIERLLQGVTETLKAEGSSLWLWENEEGGPLICQAVYHQGFQHKLMNVRVLPGQGVVGWAAQHKKGAIVHSVREDDRFFSQVDTKIGFETTGLLAVPLFLGGRILGVLEVVNKLDGPFDKQDCALIETLAASAAISIENARLVEALQEKTRQLERQNEDLDAFAHTVAHDLKNPLGLITGTAQVLQLDYHDLEEETILHHLGVIVRNSRKANSLIEELLLLAELRQNEIFIAPLHTASILYEAQKRLQYLLDSYQAELSMPSEWPVALGYAPWIEEVWVNYLNNALKYGGRPPQIELGATELEGKVKFWIKDNGIGLTTAEQEQLFRPFTRFNHVQVSGYGLGLSIVRRIIEKLNGEVGVESSGVSGEGSVFSFTLPTP